MGLVILSLRSYHFQELLSEFGLGQRLILGLTFSCLGNQLHISFAGLNNQCNQIGKKVNYLHRIPCLHRSSTTLISVAAYSTENLLLIIPKKFQHIYNQMMQIRLVTASDSESHLI